jgi:Na+-transporting methylmalonyl-CoA/oxaloacetate decarboxylase gamma subunit
MYNIFLGAIANAGGWTVAAVGYFIVFLALVLLIAIFTNIPKLINAITRMRLRREGKQVTDEPDEFVVDGDVNAAISMALYMYFNEMHDDESNVITINRITKRYSPWSSKIYNVYHTPVK